MIEPIYYKMLRDVPIKDKDGNVNTAKGFVTFNNLVFYTAGNGVKQLIKQGFTDGISENGLLYQDKKEAREIAQMNLPELEYILSLINDLISENDIALQSLVEKRDSLSEQDLLESVERKITTEYIQEKIGVSDGLHKAWQAIANRKSELWDCARLKGGN